MQGLRSKSVVLSTTRSDILKSLQIGDVAPVKSHNILFKMPSDTGHYGETQTMSSTFFSRAVQNCVMSSRRPSILAAQRLYSTVHSTCQARNALWVSGRSDGVTGRAAHSDKKFCSCRFCVLQRSVQKRQYASDSADLKSVNFQQVGDSITEGSIGEIFKKVGDYVVVDELIMTVETDKITAEIRATDSGRLNDISVGHGDTVVVGSTLFNIDVNAKPPTPSESEEVASEKSKEPLANNVPNLQTESCTAATSAVTSTTQSKSSESQPPSATSMSDMKQSSERRQEVIKMSSARKRTAQRLKDSQNTAAMLTTFNEVDMTNLMSMRSQYQNLFLEKHGVKLGFMSAFAKASAIALLENPMVNGVISNDEIITHNYVDISIAVSTPKSLVVPVVRNVETMSLPDIEKKILELSVKARDNKLTMDDMTGGTFTISNGGVFGSLMGTPIINPPQSAILGMHSIVKRPHVVDGRIEARPMMYLALTYDHRLIDGREAVTTLKRIKNLVEDPLSMLLDL